jgi:hypothetical protein
MDTIAEQEINITYSSLDEYLKYSFYEKTKSKVLSTYESSFKEALLLNFTKNWNIKENNDKLQQNNYIDLTIGTSYKKNILPEYFEENLNKLNLYFEKILSKKDQNDLINIERLQEIKDNLYQSIAEIKFLDFNIEITKRNLLKTTLLIDDDKLLIISKDIGDTLLNDKEVTYSYFIEKELIASNVENIKIFTKKFVDYLSM